MKNWTLPLLFSLALFFLVLSFILSRTTDQQTGLSPLATIEDLRGTVFATRKNSTKREKLQRKANVGSLDSLESSGDGEFLLHFDSGYDVRVLDSSLVTLDKEEEKVILIVKRGDVRIESFGAEGQLLISKEGRRYAAPEYELHFKNSRSGLELKYPNQNSKPNSGNGAEASLTSQQVQETLNARKNDFYRCYTKLLQKTPGISGECSLSFVIEPSGRVMNPSVSSSSLQDKDFQACLTEVISRVQFKSFLGDPVSAVFPIKFE